MPRACADRCARPCSSRSLGGVVAEADGVTSNAFVQELVRYFARGRPGLPAQGITAVPAQLAARARAAGAEIRLGARAERVERDGPIVEVDVAGGEALRAGRVVVAVGPETVAELTPVPRPAMKIYPPTFVVSNDFDLPPRSNSTSGNTSL